MKKSAHSQFLFMKYKLNFNTILLFSHNVNLKKWLEFAALVSTLNLHIQLSISINTINHVNRRVSKNE
jgi:hypothetical protein